MVGGGHMLQAPRWIADRRQHNVAVVASNTAAAVAVAADDTDFFSSTKPTTVDSL